MSSLAASFVRNSFVDEATKRAILGANAATSFGVPLSNLVTFKVSALDAGPVDLVPATPGGIIIPFSVLCFAHDLLPANLAANLGWPAELPPEGSTETPEDTVLWLTSTPVLALGNDESGSMVLLPNTSVQVLASWCPDCQVGRPFSIETAVVSARRAAKPPAPAPAPAHPLAKAAVPTPTPKAAEAEPPPDPEVSIVTYYTIVGGYARG